MNPVVTVFSSWQLMKHSPSASKPTHFSPPLAWEIREGDWHTYVFHLGYDRPWLGFWRMFLLSTTTWPAWSPLNLASGCQVSRGDCELPWFTDTWDVRSEGPQTPNQTPQRGGNTQGHSRVETSGWTDVLIHNHGHESHGYIMSLYLQHIITVSHSQSWLCTRILQELWSSTHAWLQLPVILTLVVWGRVWHLTFLNSSQRTELHSQEFRSPWSLTAWVWIQCGPQKERFIWCEPWEGIHLLRWTALGQPWVQILGILRV